MERKVERIGGDRPARIRTVNVAAYARVSSGKDAMLHSLAAQVSYYSEMIQNHPGWTYRGVFSDEAMSGTRDDRPGLQEMLVRCRAGEIDLVIVKSISRLSRNTVTFLAIIRELKAAGVDVFFEEQNIHTMSAGGELMLTILSGFAQEESRSISENMKWRVHKNFEEGKPWNCTILGYRAEGGTFKIEPGEAEIVRRIFDLYLEGYGTETITRILNAEGRVTRYGKAFRRWTVRKTLSNYAYTGNLLLQTTYNEDHITKRKMPNLGELPKYHAENTHEPIIDPDTFRCVQEELEKRAAAVRPKKEAEPPGPDMPVIICGNCGKRFNRKKQHGGYVWNCYTTRHRGKACCASKQIPEPQLLEALADIDLTDIESVTASDGNRLLIRLTGGKEIERTWRDRSRADAWTPEMKETARAAARKGHGYGG